MGFIPDEVFSTRFDPDQMFMRVVRLLGVGWDGSEVNEMVPALLNLEATMDRILAARPPERDRHEPEPAWDRYAWEQARRDEQRAAREALAAAAPRLWERISQFGADAAGSRSEEPPTKMSGVYFLYSSNPIRTIYIGKADSLRTRLRQHAKNPRNLAAGYSHWECFEVSVAKERTAVEEYLIAELNPLLNIAGRTHFAELSS